MSKKLKAQISSGKAVDRSEVLTILQAGLAAGEMRFVRQVTENWLDAYPYDLPVELLRARALLQESKADKAAKILVRLCELDPEFLDAQQLLAKVARRVKPAISEQARAAAAYLLRPSEVTKDIQAWARSLIAAQLAFAAGNLKKAEADVQAALLSEPPSPLPGLLHIQIAGKQGLTWLAIHNLVELYSEQWPHCLQLRLQNAAYLMESGSEKEAVDILHDCVAEDVSGQVARRLWGDEHRFSALWPRQLTQTIDIPIPARVAASLGWNQIDSIATAKTIAVSEKASKSVSKLLVDDLPTLSSRARRSPERSEWGGIPLSNQDLTTSSVKDRKQTKSTLYNKETPRQVEKVPPPVVGNSKTTESDQDFEQTLDSVLSALPETLIDLEEINTDTEQSLRLRADGRYPAYIILSSKDGLLKQYGHAGFNEVDAAMRALAKSTDALPHWSAYVLYADDAESTASFGLKAAKAGDPWEIKNLVADLDEALRKNGEMIGALLIVGGPHIVPFHHLPNPVDDEDKDVPSDNPYASLDENYFMPTWPTGRLPNGSGKDAATLIKLLGRIDASRDAKTSVSDPLTELIRRLLTLFGLWKPSRTSFGYSAEIWQRASHSVYRTIGERRGLSISPPTATGRLPKEASKPLQVAYFNLHGVQDGPDWYGQRDPQQTTGGPDYPVALSPSDVINSGRAPQIVYTEACYGANVFNKNIDNALALKFLDSGSKAVVGSTVTSYGSVTTPLIAADLLGQTFWKLLNEGHPVGEALRRAKIAMAHTMHRRQGYLDGEDQKTLISFVLYGDPLAQTSAEGNLPKRILRPDQGALQVDAICDRAEGHSARVDELPAETMATVKAVVKSYLPGMQGSQATYSHEHTNCRNHNCPLPHANAKAIGLAPQRSLVTLSKKVPGDGRMHQQYARITMDAQGKVVKLAVSR